MPSSSPFRAALRAPTSTATSRSRRARRLAGVTVSSLALLAIPGVAAAGVQNAVPGTGNIKAAYDLLTGPGPHTINLTGAGVYTETVTIDVAAKNVTIVGDKNNTKIVYSGLGTIFSVGSGGTLTMVDVVMDGSVPGLVAPGPSSNLCEFQGGFHAVEVSGGTLNVDGSTFRCFFGPSAGAIHASSSIVDIVDSTFELNIAPSAGGHVHADGGSFTSIGSHYEYGAAILGAGGGLYLANNDVFLEDNGFYYNESNTQGGAVAMYGTAASEIWGNQFGGNTALTLLEYVVTALTDPIGTGDVEEVPILDIEVTGGEGGAIFTETPDLDLWNNTFCGNLSDVGGAVHAEFPPGLNVQNNVFAENFALHYGGGLYASADVATIEPSVVNNTFLMNEAGRNPPFFPPAVHAVGAGGHVFLDGTLMEFTNNVAALAPFGAGLSGVTGPIWDLGEPIAMDYNIWYHNCDEDGCSAGDPLEWQELAGDLESHTLSPYNYFADPYPTYFGVDAGNCYPDAFYPKFDSPLVDAGDPAITDAYDLPYRASDIGAFGGPRADVEDVDADQYADIYDCNDYDATIHPEAVESCDLIDNNCNGEIDEGFPNQWWYDSDGDGFGNNALLPDVTSCAPPAGAVDNNGDCDDADATINPDQAEVCDDIDNDCDGVADEEDQLEYRLFYLDNDGDGYGTTASTLTECFPPDAPPTGYVAESGDCADSDPTRNPGAMEVCDGIDNDCNPTTNEDTIGGTFWYADADGDGYGADSGSVQDCDQPAGYVAAGGDCDDTSADLNPGATEVCNDLDDDCDGEVDNDPTDGSTWYPDADGDGIGDPDNAITTCDDVAPNGYFGEADLTGINDCDDADPDNACAACGCKAVPTPSSSGMLVLLALGLIRRRRR